MATETLAKNSRRPWSASISVFNRLFWKAQGSLIEPRPGRESLAALPTELLFDIFQYLEVWELWFRIALVNRRLRVIANLELTSRSGFFKGLNREYIDRLASLNKEPAQGTSKNRRARLKGCSSSPLQGVRTYFVNPTIRSLICHSESRGRLTCYYNNFQLTSVQPGNATPGSSILLEPIVYPAVRKARLYVHPISHFKDPIIVGGWYAHGIKLEDGGSTGLFSWGKQSRKYAVTIIDIVTWLEEYMRKHQSVFGEFQCFRIDIGEGKLYRNYDKEDIMDVFISVGHVDASKFLPRAQQV